MFIDLSIKPEEKSIIPDMCRNALRLGFSAVGLTLDQSTTPQEIQAVKRVTADFKPRLELFTRTEIAPPNRRILLKMLRGLRNRFEMISVRCVSNETALVSARDRRVDTVFFPCDGNLRMSTGVASTFRNLLELELQPLIMGQGERRRTCFLRLRRDVRRALQAGVPIVASSGARDLLQQRSPLALSSILTTLGLDRSESIKAIGSPTLSMLEPNRLRFSQHHLEVGVVVTKKPRGKA